MNKINIKKKHLFVSLIFIELFLLLITPLLELNFFNLSEDWSEVIFIIILFSIFSLAHYFYVKETRKSRNYLNQLEERLRETFKYIGSIKFQIEELKKVFSHISKYPENKKDLQATFINISNRILGMINSDWVYLKIIDLNKNSTLHEHFTCRGNKSIEKINFDNQCLLNGECLRDGQVVITSKQDNFNIKAFCILSVEPKDKNQEFMISSAISQLEMIFVIFNSFYYKKKKE